MIMFDLILNSMKLYVNCFGAICFESTITILISEYLYVTIGDLGWLCGTSYNVICIDSRHCKLIKRTSISTYVVHSRMLRMKPHSMCNQMFKGDIVLNLLVGRQGTRNKYFPKMDLSLWII